MKLDLKQLYLGVQTLTIYRNAAKDGCFAKFAEFLRVSAYEEDMFVKAGAYSDFVTALYEKGGNFGLYISDLLECDDNFYAKSYAAGEGITDDMSDSFKAELKFFGKLTWLTSVELLISSGLPLELAKFDNTRIDFNDTIPKRLSESAKYGYGMYARYGMFRADAHGKLIPVLSPDNIDISSLIGYEDERKQVIDNTRALLENKPAANVLLCGDAGTGKSSTVKAVANMFKADGIRLIELRKDQLGFLPDVMGEIAGNPLKFIIFVDDLSFACDDDGFGALKAALEGSASAKASNAVIYATSNRRHLVKETFSARQGDEVHRRDTMEELMSLSERFGLTVLYSKPNKALYLQIASALVKEHGIEMDEKELELKAEAFALAKGGRSARVAGQFADSLLTQEHN